MSAFVDPTTRVSLIAGTSNNNFQIPNNPGQSPSPVFPNSTFNSALLNENQWESTQFGVLSVQKSVDGFDGQLSYFTKYNALHFLPDPTGDLQLNGIASDITRTSYTNGIQGDGSYQLNPAHTLRAGFSVSAEQAFVGNSSLVVPCMACDGTDNGAPETITDNVSKTGFLAGVYVQDEWKITNQFTVNAGLRFDQMDEFVSANQLSPRLSFTYKPFENTTFHAGYARQFTPPELVEAAPANIGLVQRHSGAVGRPEQSGPAGTLELLRCRRRSKDTVRMQLPGARKTAPASISASMPITRSRPIYRQRSFRPGARTQRLQLCQRLERRHRIPRQVQQWQLPGLCQCCRGPAESD